ncbi:MAG: ADP-ribosylglycohydrolase family protein [Gemmatimonadales bacterium]
MLGKALGDALGFVVEAAPPDVAAEYVQTCLRPGRAGSRRHPRFSFGQYSDDTQLARALLLGVRDAGAWSASAFASRLSDLFRDGLDVGAGPGSRAAAARLLTGTGWRESGTPAPYAGNGSAMRVAPLGVLLAGDPEAMLVAAREQSFVTHQDRRCAAGAVAVAWAALLAARTESFQPRAFLDEVGGRAGAEDASVGQAIERVAEWLELEPAAAAERLHAEGLDQPANEPWRGISSSVAPSVAWSLYAFARSPDDYWTTVCTAIAVGGDTDTMAAIAGALAGARLGPEALPRSLLEQLNDRGAWRADELARLARDCAALFLGA